ncbi:MAG: hypothetical protein HQK79_18095 [Desulfobacterales bacterium]|nr:hypothetical protein [Desulfobacterales bacterium]
MKITVKFLEPFRLLEWIKHENRNRENKPYLRGQSFARWHKNKDGKGGRPYITGSLLRSAVIQSAEKLLVLSGGKINNKSCCPGEFSTKNNNSVLLLRQRATFKWTDDKLCNSSSPCPFCELLGRHDQAGKNAKKENGVQFHIHFGNLNLPYDKLYSDIEEIAFKRTLNRIDQDSGKAFDFLRVWEIDNLEVPLFTGEISISNIISPESIRLLKDSLSFVDKLCGSLCIIKQDDNDLTLSIPSISKSDISERAKILVDAIGKYNEADKIRIMADAMLALRRDKNLVSSLPKDHDNKENHYLWDIKEGNSKSIRLILKEQANALDNQGWRNLCEQAGQLIFEKAKQLTGGISVSQRILGDIEYLSEPELISDTVFISSVPQYETIIQGKLIAKTPFFFGLENDETKQSSYKLLLDNKNSYRIPRSAIRGILRRDLKNILGTGCNVELGGVPCPCKVCSIMRNITIMDSRSNYSEPPEIRNRIRINTYTGTVDEGALFDMEVGPEGLEFPFTLRYRGRYKNPDSEKIPDSLEKVLTLWTEGQAFLSGSASTGKGRFKIEDIKYCRLDLKDASKRDEYLLNHGWRDNLDKLKFDNLPLKIQNLIARWKKVEIEIKLASPFLNGDPIRALLESNSGDIVSFRKFINGGTQEVYAYKSESFKGVVRAAVSKFEGIDSITEKTGPLGTLTHQDCSCLLCSLFGSEYETGKMRFEDLIFDPQPVSKIFDHVAIDRFTGGAVDKKKFDDNSIVGSHSNQLTLKGLFWIRNDITDEEYNALSRAFTDIKNNIYPLGAKGSIGYGCVQDLTTDNSNINLKTINLNYKPIPQKINSNIKIDFNDNEIYYPHYFLEPSKTVNRIPVPIGHEKFDENLLTGKITCTLNTLSPLIVPDTTNDNFFKLADEKEKSEGKPYHKSYNFFSVNRDISIPGSELRGMISSVYEAVTNSCFRIFDEKYRLSWRMDVSPAVLREFKPGMVIKDHNDLKIIEMEEFRYPFYDQNIQDIEAQNKYFEWEYGTIKITKKSIYELEKLIEKKNILNKIKELQDIEYKSEYALINALEKLIGRNSLAKCKSNILKHAERKGEFPRYDHPTDTDRMMLSLSGKNRNLKNKKEKIEYIIIKPNSKSKATFMYLATPLNNIDEYENESVARKAHGYLKITGPNKIEKENVDSIDSNFKPVPQMDDQIILEKVWLRKVFVLSAKKRTSYRDRLIPEFICYDKIKGIKYTMNKRSERIFVEKKERIKKEITQQAIEKFEILIQEYHKNAEQQQTPEVFRTILPQNGTINDGDLVYFREENNQVVEIIPVRISRKVDDNYIGKRIDEQLRPCHGDWIEEDDISKLNAYPEKRLFTRNEKGLCPACRLFGTGSYKGRVRFGLAKLDNEPKWLMSNDGRLTLPLLERPRPTWSIPDDKKENKVLGRKFYVHHDGWKTVFEGKNPSNGETIQSNPNNRTVKPLGCDNKFTFDIYFENLEDYELGLLFYTLQLEKGLSHKLGMAKSMGFGSVEIDIKNISLRKDPENWEDGNSKIADWIKEGEKMLTKWFQTDFNTIEHLNNLKKLLYFSGNKNLKVFYPTLKKEGKIPGYEELKKDIKDRKKMLTTPWMPWHSEE